MLAPNTLLQNRYLVTRQLGQGGMGAVYEATDQRFGRTVALKQAFFTTNALGRAFEREARLLNDLRHPALPVVIDYFAERDGCFLVMDFVPGEDLAARLARERRPFAPEEVLRWADQVLDALEYLHNHEPPIVHRDIKPQNLKLTPRGDIRLLDFGLAKGHAADLSQATGGRSIAGYTPHYAPIEQVQGAGTDVRSDLYSLAATVYHLVTGRIPPDALERATCLLNGQPDPLRPASELNPRVPADVDEVLRRAMATGANQRPASATAMRRALREAGGQGVPYGAPLAAVGRPPETAPPGFVPETAGYAAAAATAAQQKATTPSTDVAPADRHSDPRSTRPEPGATVAAGPAASRRRALALAAGLLATAVVAGAAYAVYLATRPAPDVVVTPPAEAGPPPPALKPLRFETVVLDAEGRVAETRRGEARYFVEDLGGPTLEMVEVPAGSFDMGSPATAAYAPAEAFVVRAAYGPQSRPYPNEPAEPTQARPRPAARPRVLPKARPRPDEAEPEQKQAPEQKPAEPKPQAKKRAAPPKRAPEPEPAPDPDDERERPQRRVSVPALFVGRLEVTQAQWRAVANWPKVERDLNPDPSEFKGDALPVENVSWEDATEFCARLSKKTGRAYRLPTEAEWEYACRAGTSTPFAFGETITAELANYDARYGFGGGPVGRFRRKTVAVGALGAANAFGLSDMHGNVWEWCLDPWHPDYTGAPADARSWEEGGDPYNRVLRGGSWITGPSDCRSTRRVDNAPGNRNSDVGFRVVMAG